MKKKLTRREFLQLSAMAGAGAVLAACGPTPAPQVKEVVVTATPVVKKPVKLTAWFADRRTINIMTQEMMKAQFEVRYPHISVEVMFVPESEIPAKMTTAYAAGLAPDVTALDEMQLAGLMEQGFVHPIPDGLIDVRKEMGDRIADVYKVNGKYWALPNGNMPQVLYVNLDLLNKLGYKLADIPSKWDDFIKWAKGLTIWKGDEIKQWGYTWVGAPWVWLDYAYQKRIFTFKNNLTLLD